VFQTEASEHRFVPEVRTFDGGKGINYAEREDAFDRARNKAKCEGLGVVFVPCLNIESQKS